MEANKFFKVIIFLFLAIVIAFSVILSISDESFDTRDSAQDTPQAPFVSLSAYDETAQSICFFISDLDEQVSSYELNFREQTETAVPVGTEGTKKWEACLSSLDANMADFDVVNITALVGEQQAASWDYEFILTFTQPVNYQNWEVSDVTDGAGSVVGLIVNSFDGEVPFGFENIVDGEKSSIAVSSLETHSLEVDFTPPEGFNKDTYLYNDPFSESAEPAVVQTPTENIITADSSYLFVTSQREIPKYPDMNVENVLFDTDNIYPDTNFQFTATVKNVGQKEVSEFSVGIYINGSIRKSYTVSNLLPGETDSHVEALLAPNEIGQHTLRVICDHDEQVEESDENNNFQNNTFDVKEVPCGKTCGEKEILTSDCTCKSVECKQDGHCSGFEVCDLSNYTCTCQDSLCSLPKVVNDQCNECVCPSACSDDQIQLADCSCKQKVVPKPGQKVEKKLTLEVLRPTDDQIFDKGEKVVFEAEAYYNTGDNIEKDKLVWESSANGQLGKGNLVSYTDFDIGSHTVALTYKGEHERKITIHILAGDEITIYKEKPANGETVYKKDLTVSALISSPRGKVDTTKMEFEFNDKNVLRDSFVGETYVEYTTQESEVSEGENEVSLYAQNYKDQEIEKNWTFEYAEKPEEVVVVEDDKDSTPDSTTVLLIIGVALVFIVGLIIIVSILQSRKNRFGDGPTGQSQTGQQPVQPSPQNNQQVAKPQVNQVNPQSHVNQKTAPPKKKEEERSPSSIHRRSSEIPQATPV